MRGGDRIFIAHMSDATILVTGEVRQPLVIPVPYGFISAREALGIAGGIPFTGSRGCIQVIRGEPVRPKIFAFSWKEMLPYPNSSLLLMPGDIIFISEKPITQYDPDNGSKCDEKTSQEQMDTKTGIKNAKKKRGKYA